MNIFDEKTDKEQFKEVMSGLNLWQKIEHLFHYYGWMLFFVAAAVMLVWGVVALIDNSSTRTLYCGTAANVNLSNAGWEFLTDGYRDELGYTEEDKCIVDVFPTQVDTSEGEGFFLFAYTAEISTGQVLNLVRGNSLDFVMGDEYSTLYYLEQECAAPVDQVLTAEQTALLEDKFLYTTDAAGQTYAAAVDISEFAFITDCVTDATGPIYIFFPGNTGRPELTHQFMDYLMDYTAA